VEEYVGSEKRKSNSYRKPEGKGPVERLRRRWQDNIKTYFEEIWREGVDFIKLFQDSVVTFLSVSKLMVEAPTASIWFITHEQFR
jgi:hypothetical protein